MPVLGFFRELSPFGTLHLGFSERHLSTFRFFAYLIALG